MSTIVAIGHLSIKDDSDAFFFQAYNFIFSVINDQEIIKLLKESDEAMCDDDVLDPTYRIDDSEE